MSYPALSLYAAASSYHPIATANIIIPYQTRPNTMLSAISTLYQTLSSSLFPIVPNPPNQIFGSPYQTPYFPCYCPVFSILSPAIYPAYISVSNAAIPYQTAYLQPAYFTSISHYNQHLHPLRFWDHINQPL